MQYIKNRAQSPGYNDECMVCGNDGFYLEVNYSSAWISENMNQAKIVAENTVKFSADLFSLLKAFEKFADQKNFHFSFHSFEALSTEGMLPSEVHEPCWGYMDGHWELLELFRVVCQI